MAAGESHMRLILGIIIGCAITVGAAYVTDSMSSSAPEAKEQMVNWDVVGKRTDNFIALVRAGWKRIAG
jgi:hypothetical protein